MSQRPRNLMQPLMPSGQFGAQLTPQAVAMRVFAPSATAAWVVFYDEATGPAGRFEVPLGHVGRGVWESVLPGLWEGRFYTFRFAGIDHDERAEVVDPWAVNTVDSARRARLTQLAHTHPPGWELGRRGPALAAPTDAVICELHVRDLTISSSSGVARRGGYLGWCESGTTLPGRSDITTAVDHLVELGVTHVQLLPVQDFDSDDLQHCYFWGYMTAAFFSPEGMFASDPMTEARVRELKHLIQCLHLRGLGVILDIVPNHFGRTAGFDAVAPNYYVRHWPDGTRSNGSGCGNDFRSESEQGRRFIIECLKFWVREYGVDGFRVDLMALIDRETLVQAETELRALRPDLLLYGEPWTAGPTALEGLPMDKAGLPGTSWGAFNDEFRNALKGGSDSNSPGFIQRGWDGDGVKAGLLGQPSWGVDPGQIIQYMTCHDNLCLYDKLVLSRPEADDAARERMALLGFTLLLLSQGVPFLHGGDEFFRSKGGEANSYQSPDGVNKIDWRRKAQFESLSTQVRALIALRRAHPLFRLRTAAEVEARCRMHPHSWWDIVVLEIDGHGLPGESWRRALLLVNGSPDTDCAFDLPEGAWQTMIGTDAPHHRRILVSHQSVTLLAELSPAT
jgi:pullulanase